MNKTKTYNIPQLRFPEFSEEWHKSILNDLSSKISDGIHSTPKYSDDGEFYFVNGNNLVKGKIKFNKNTKTVSEEEFKKHKRPLNSSTLLLSINGTIGNLAIYNNEQIVLGKSACYININKDYSIYFYYYILQSNQVVKYFLSELTGSTIKNLSLSTIKKLKISIPSHPEQQKIATFLTSVDKRITQLTQQIENVTQYKKGVMQKIFKQELRFKPALSEVEGDENGKNFTEWVECKLSSFNELIHGDGDWILSQDISSNGEHQIVQLGNIGFGLFVDKKLKTISDEKFLELKGTPIEKDDLLINRMVDGNINCCLMPYSGNYITSVDVCWVRKNTFFNNYFLMSMLLSESNQNKLLRLSSGSGRVRISKKNLFNKFSFFLPCLEEQTKIANFLSGLDIKIVQLNQQLTAATNFKKALLQQMFV